MTSWNHGIIEEFRANEGKVGGHFEGWPLLLLHHLGARTGTERINPLAYLEVDGGYAVFASKGGADNNPDWLHNLIAHPDTSVEVGTAQVKVRARLAEGEERRRIWEEQKAGYPVFASYEEKTARDHIPVVILERV